MRSVVSIESKIESIYLKKTRIHLPLKLHNQIQLGNKLSLQVTYFISNIRSMRPWDVAQQYEVEPSACNCVYMCACFSTGPLLHCCCYSYHPSQEQISCQNKHSHFRLTGEIFLNGCSWVALFIRSGMSLNKVFGWWISKKWQTVHCLFCEVFNIGIYQQIH